MLNALKKIGYGIAVVLALSMIVAYLFYHSFRTNQLATLESASQVIETAAGPIEYQIDSGTNPVLLFLHGTPGGFDQRVSVPGMRVLAPSRPGYLRTPLSVGRTPAEQADAMAALLDALHLDSAVVMGVSGGGPPAISFAARHPQRTKALIAMEAVSQPFTLGDHTEVPAWQKSGCCSGQPGRLHNATPVTLMTPRIFQL